VRVQGRFILVAVAVVLLAMAVAAQAERGRGTANIRSKVVIHKLTPNVASGQLSANVNECEARRPVHLFREGGAGQPDVRVGKDITNEKGIWEIREPLPAGSYFAEVGLDRKGDFLCDQDNSPPVSLP
jgi:hypothetical protein